MVGYSTQGADRVVLALERCRLAYSIVSDQFEEMQPESLSDAQLRSLAKEIHDGIIGSETDWLEWKSALDLAKAEARFEVSRQILGMANRVPGLARRNRGGYGYILVGVEQGG